MNIPVRIGDTVKAFHPQTLGVIHIGKVLLVRMDSAKIEFSVGIGKNTKFWIALEHITHNLTQKIERNQQ